MNLADVGCTLTYAVTAPTSFVFNVVSAATERQIIHEERLELEPPGLRFEWSEPGDAGYRFVRLRADPCTLSLRYRASVELRPETEEPPRLQEVEHEALPDEVLQYLNPSRYCESDRLVRLVNQEFGQLPSGYDRVNAICDWVHAHLDYVAGSTDTSSSACDVLLQRAGVCRDYAHVTIAICRALGIPARYVSGFACGLQPPDFHGFLEVWLNSRWYLFDPTRMAPVSGFVRIGIGRDAADASFATIVGQAGLQSMSVFASRIESDGEGDVGEEVAVSTA
jgi:transglutaminase-like putative cysteine protease